VFPHVGSLGVDTTVTGMLPQVECERGINYVQRTGGKKNDQAGALVYRIKEYCLLGYNTAWSSRSPLAFWRTRLILLLSSELWKGKTSKTQATLHSRKWYSS
jgi:hypothetical protein